MANFSIGQRITARGEDFMVVNSQPLDGGEWIIEARGLSELVKDQYYYKNTFPSKPYNWSEMNKKEQTNHLMNQRSLMYVAITRAMQMVRITGVGEKSELL